MKKPEIMATREHPNFFFILIPLLILPTLLFSRNPADTMVLARKNIESGNPGKAYNLMKEYCRYHPDDFNANWLFAKAAYLDGHPGVSGRHYENAIRLSPENLYAQLDYADFLVGIGHYTQARVYLERYLRYDPGNFKALFLLSKIAYWQSDFKRAALILDMIKGKDSADVSILSLRREIKIAESPWLGMNANFFADNQPMQGFSPSVQSGFFLHPMASPYVKLTVPAFDTGGVLLPAAWIQGGNRAVFSKAKMILDVSLGLIRFPSGNSYSWSGSAVLTKTFLYHLPVTLTFCRNPYFSTLGSVSATILEDHISLTAGWDMINSWYGQATFDLSYYPIDRADIFTASGWFFTPPVKFSLFTTRIGYGYSYSTSQSNNFINQEPLDVIMEQSGTESSINGKYTPYFTPKGQQVQSILVNIGMRLSKKINAILDGNFGVYATADIPYLYLDTLASGTILDIGHSQGKTIYLVRNFSSDQRFFPVQVSAKVLYKISPVMNLEADYSFCSTYYFIRHYAGVGFTLNFAHGRK
jgi:Tfp pilus assembly protein PilF